MAAAGLRPPPFSGVGVALATFFAGSGSIDTAATADHAARLVDAGLAAVVVAGSTGEAAALDLDERGRLLRAVVAAVRDRAVVVAGTGAPWTREAVRLTKQACDLGAAAVLVLSPVATSDPRRYYEAVAAAASGDPGVPVLAYHYPPMSQPGIPVAALPGLPVAGLKDSSGDPERLLATLSSWDRPVYVGSSAIVSFAGGVGATGAILALANLEPDGCLAAFAGDGKAQLALWDVHDRCRTIGGLKEAMAERWGTPTGRRIG
jgi:4-hydroxy-tetrahydrodipicolinate synthase